MRAMDSPATSTRRGYALPLVVVLALVLGGILWAVNTVVTGYRHQATRFRDGEVAHHAATGALALAEATLEAVFDGSFPEEPAARELFEYVTRSLPGDLDGHTEMFSHPALAWLVPRGLDGDVVVHLRFRDVRPLKVPVPAGYVRDPYDKEGTLEVESWARVGGAYRGLTVRRPFRSLYRLPPVLGRFALLAGELSGTSEAANALTYAPRVGLFQRPGDAGLAWPLVVYPLPAENDGATSASRWKGRALEPVARGGWVGLLGSTPWVLNTTFGPGLGSPLEEGVALRNYEAVVASGVVAGAYEKVRRVGFARNILDLPVFSDVEAGTVPAAASLLHLGGDAREPMPPVVLGPVFRRYLTWSKLGPSPEGPFTSLHAVNEDDFEHVEETFRRAGGRGGYPAYARLMARSVLEPYNRTYDYLVTADEVVTGEGRVEPGDTPFTPARHLAGDAGAPWIRPGPRAGEDFLYPSRARAEAAGRGTPVRIGTEEDAALFEGTPDLLLEGLAVQAEARAVWRVEAAGDRDAATIFRERFLADGRTLRLGTSVHVVGDALGLGDLEVAVGGTVVVDGDLTVSGPIRTAPGEALALVSLRGDIRVTDAQPIRAMLIACEGEVIPPQTGMDVRGMVATRRFDPARWTASRGAYRIVYDPVLNPAPNRERARQLRVHLGRERTLLVERR